MALIAFAFGCFFLSGFLALMTNRLGRVASLIGSIGPMVGSILGLMACIQMLLHATPLVLRLPWNLPLGSFYIELDALSAFFLIPFFILIPITALYGYGYLKKYEKRKALGISWFFFNTLVASLVAILLARNGLLFLICWEIMSVSSFFLVTFENEQAEVRSAGLIYLIATHIGTIFLLVFFILLGQANQSLDFKQLTDAASYAPHFTTLLFCLALVGFGTKAGLIPFHVWLPVAHPAAPSHVSALMSAVMIKTGLYGIIRTITLLGTPSILWGWILITIGLTSALIGVLFALVQHDIKRLLAYSSIENMGIMTLGIGIGLVGQLAGYPQVALLGWMGGLLHMLNHSLFKGLLFLGAGAVSQISGTREIDKMGGLLKRMPWTGFSFLLGALAISGLPPFNGFISEFLIYLGAFKEVGAINTPVPETMSVLITAFSTLFGLALVGGMAAICFTKAFGMVFLGEPRSEVIQNAHEVKVSMRLAMLILALGCLVLGLAAPFLPYFLQPLCAQVLPASFITSASLDVLINQISQTLFYITVISALFLILIIVFLLIRKYKKSPYPASQTVTWDCGYLAPNARMQYTASSFVQPLATFFRTLLQLKEKHKPVAGLFPHHASLQSESADPFHHRFYSPIFESIKYFFSRWHWIQHGRLHLYILYIALVLIILLVWKIG
jgi:formate hydrogenlyase subunit 3/multisubunit Na+/H+ antiporter MnhD subunit